MKKTKAEKGITLIALIITIIVLIILAVVTIQAVQEHGIIGYAKKAQTEYDKKAEEENSTLQGYAGYMEEHFGEEAKNKGPKSVIDDSDIGKSVDYKVDIDGVEGNSDWKIFYQGTAEDGEEANGRIYLIAADVVKDEILTAKAPNSGLTLDENKRMDLEYSSRNGTRCGCEQ